MHRTLAEKWFQNIRGKGKAISSQWDMYYLCLMLGLITGRQGDDSKAKEFYRDFTDEYKANQKTIIAVFLQAELKALRVDLSDRVNVEAQINKYLDPESASNLTSAAQKRMNQYAVGGYEVLTEEMDKPHLEHAFFVRYSELIRSLCLSRDD
jgi:hypothetical protein